MHYLNSMTNPLKKVILKHPKNAFIDQIHLNNNYKKYNYVDVPNYHDSLDEYKQFEKILHEHVEEIYYLPYDERTGLDSIYAHDAVKFTPKGAILLNSGKKIRQAEKQAYKTFLQEHDIPIVGELSGEATCDGGDIIWLNEDILLVGRGYRTNDIAIEELKQLTKPFVKEFIVVQLPHANGENECLHLMSFLSMINNNTAVVYSPLMPVFLRQKLIELKIKLIEVPDSEYEQLGCNVLALSPEVCLMVSGNNETKSQLESLNIEVLEYEGKNISYLGTGGPTCLTAPMVRKNIIEE